MDEEPHQPGREPVEANLPDAGDGAEAADGRDAAEVAVPEGHRLLAVEPPQDRVGRVEAALHRDLGDAGQAVEARHVAHREDLWMSGEGQVREHGDAAGPVERGSGRLSELSGQRRCLHAGRPDGGEGVDPRAGAVGLLDVHAEGVDADHPRTHPELDTEARQLSGGLARQPLPEGRERCVPGVHDDDADGRRVEGAELTAQAAHGQLTDLPRQLHAGRAGTDDHDRQPLRPLRVVGRQLGHLERAEDAPPQLERVVDRLHAGSEPGELVVPEVGLAHPRRDDEAVVGDLHGVEAGGGDGVHDPAVEVEPGHRSQLDPDVLVPADDVTYRRRDLAR